MLPSCFLTSHDLLLQDGSAQQSNVGFEVMVPDGCAHSHARACERMCLHTPCHACSCRTRRKTWLSCYRGAIHCMVEFGGMEFDVMICKRASPEASCHDYQKNRNSSTENLDSLPNHVIQNPKLLKLLDSVRIRARRVFRILHIHLHTCQVLHIACCGHELRFKARIANHL